MKKIIFLVSIVILIFTANIFGQPKRKKIVRALPEVNDEVLVTFRKKQANSATARKKKSPSKYANQEVSYRKKSKRKVRSLTHDPEFENWANRKRKVKGKRYLIRLKKI